MVWCCSPDEIVNFEGVVKTKALIRSRVWFPEIDKRVEDAVRSCHKCQLTTAKQSFEP